MGLRVGGLATGIDTGALIDGLMAAERRPLDLVELQKSQLEAQQSLFRDLNTRLLALREAAAVLDNQNSFLSAPSFEEEFLAYDASSSDESILTASANGDAAPGAIDVHVDSLASVGRRISAAFASSDGIIANAGETLQIDYGGASPIDITVGAGGASLDDLASLIETDLDNAGNVGADVIFDGSTYRLVISGTQTGAANDIMVSGTVQGPGASPFIDPALTQTAQDAQLQVFGITITRDSNEITDAVPGLTLRLHGAHSQPTANTQVDLARDDDVMGEKVQTFVDAYNDVMDFINAQSKFNETTEAAGPLSGDATLRSIQQTVQGLLVKQYSFPGNDFSALGQIGIEIGRDGTLSLEPADLSAALDQNPLAVRQFLAGDGIDDGFATAVARALDPLTESGTGTLAIRDEAFDDRIEGLDRQIERYELRLEKREELLVRQFASLESLVSSLQAQGNSLLSLFTGQS